MVQAIARSEVRLTRMADAPSRKRVADSLAEVLTDGETICYNAEVQVRAMLDRIKRLKQHDKVSSVFHRSDTEAVMPYPMPRRPRTPMADGTRPSWWVPSSEDPDFYSGKRMVSREQW